MRLDDAKVLKIAHEVLHIAKKSGYGSFEDEAEVDRFWRGYIEARPTDNVLANYFEDLPEDTYSRVLSAVVLLSGTERPGALRQLWGPG